MKLTELATMCEGTATILSAISFEVLSELINATTENDFLIFANR